MYILLNPSTSHDLDKKFRGKDEIDSQREWNAETITFKRQI